MQESRRLKVLLLYVLLDRRNAVQFLTYSLGRSHVVNNRNSLVELFSESPTSIKDINAFQLNKVVDGSLNISGLAEGTLVKIFDASGKQMTSTYDTTINVSNLKAGMYIMKAGNQIVKFVKK